MGNHPIDIPNAKDYLAVIVDKIHSVPAMKKDVDLEQTDGFTILYSKILEQWCDKYAPLLKWLIEREVIGCNNSYSNNQKSAISKGYKFTDKYQVMLKPFIVTLQTLVSKLNGNRRLKRQSQPILESTDLINLYPDIDVTKSYKENAYEKLGFLKTYFNSKLQIDSKKAETYLINLLEEESTNPDEKYLIHKFNCRKMIADKLVNRDYFFNVDDTSGRLHTNLTNQKKELRAFVSYDSKLLSSIDLKNSQPLLSITLLDENLFHQNNMMNRILKYQKEVSLSFSTMLVDLIHNKQNAKDVLLFKQLICEARIYEYFAERLILAGIIPFDTPQPLQRKFAKNALMKTMFSKNKAIKAKGFGEVIKVFKDCFPNVYEIFSLIKHHNHSTLACVLQNLEAEIFLHKIAVNVHKQYPDLPIFTIHDSIATYTTEIDKLLPIVKYHLYSVLKFEPELEVEDWMENDNPTSKYEITSISYGFVDDEFYRDTYSLKEAAQYFGMGRNKFTQKLRDMGILIKNEKKCNKPKDEYLLKGYFQVKKKNQKGNVITFTPIVTSDGMGFLKSRLG